MCVLGGGGGASPLLMLSVVDKWPRASHDV